MKFDMKDERDRNTKAIFLEKISIFKEIDFSKNEAVLDLFEKISIAKGKDLIKQGERADHVYIVMDGSLSVSIESDKGKTIQADNLGPGELIGEVAVVFGEKRTATVTANVKTTLLQIKEEDFLWLLQKFSSTLYAVKQIIYDRIKSNRVRSSITRLFDNIKTDELNAFVNNAKILEFDQGDTIYQYNEPSNDIYLLINGRLKERRHREDETETVREIFQGEFFGELDFLSGRNRTSSIYAQRRSLVVSIPASIFKKLQQESGYISEKLLQMYVDRSSQERVAIQRRPISKVIGIVPFSSDLPYRELSEDLANRLGELGINCSLWNSEAIQRELNLLSMENMVPGHPLFLRYLNWLTDLSYESDCIILVFDPQENNWNRACLDSCDELLLFAEGQTSFEEPRSLELSKIDHDHTRTRLVFFHENEKQRPKNTREWLDRIRPTDHYHINLEGEKDRKRLARYIGNQATGLVLGGGGARALAHAGVLKALEEAGVQIDFICGSNLGAILAAFVAQKLPYEKVREQLMAFMEELGIDYTFPKVCLYTGYGLEDSLKNAFDGLNIEDLWIPYFSVSTNLSMGREQVDRKGSLFEALLSTNSTPGIYPPSVREGLLYVDGDIINSLPVVELRERMLDGTIYSSNVMNLEEMSNCRSAEYPITLWKSLFTSLSQTRDYHLPDIVSLILRAETLGNLHYNIKKNARVFSDTFIHVPVEQVGYFDYDRASELERAGYEHTRKLLSET